MNSVILQVFEDFAAQMNKTCSNPIYELSVNYYNPQSRNILKRHLWTKTPKFRKFAVAILSPKNP